MDYLRNIWHKELLYRLIVKRQVIVCQEQRQMPTTSMRETWSNFNLKASCQVTLRRSIRAHLGYLSIFDAFTMHYWIHTLSFDNHAVNEVYVLRLICKIDLLKGNAYRRRQRNNWNDKNIIAIKKKVKKSG